jgi:hypothetical protein
MSNWDQSKRGKNLVWFGEIERKLAKLSMTILLTVLPLNYFWGKPCSQTKWRKVIACPG